MTTDNLSLLQQQLRYLGFGESEPLYEKLELLIQSKAIRFEVSTKAYFDEWSKMVAELCFQWSDAVKMYSLDSYKASLHYDNAPENDKTQTFFIVKGSGITFKEAFNLLQGRALNKDLTNLQDEKYNAWIQLDFNERTVNNNYRVRQFRTQFGYNLEKVLQSYPIQELKTEELKLNLIRSLKKGNIHPVTFVKENKIEKMFIEACPQYKTITIYSIATRMAKVSLFQKKRQTKGTPLPHGQENDINHKNDAGKSDN